MHRVPNQTVQLGRALELVTENSDRATLWDEVDGWHLLTTPEAEDRQPGHARLFLVPGKLEGQREAKENKGGDTYNAWHSRNPEFVGELDVPEEFGELIGRATRLDYASDKWNNPGDVVEYTHDFTGAGKPPLVYGDFDGNKPRGFMLVGGDMAITSGGIA